MNHTLTLLLLAPLAEIHAAGPPAPLEFNVNLVTAKPR